jgi:hypothetical protein
MLFVMISRGYGGSCRIHFMESKGWYVVDASNVNDDRNVVDVDNDIAPASDIFIHCNPRFYL